MDQNNPHFYKMIMEHTLTQKKLWIPESFVRKCGETLTEFVIVKDPIGVQWIMKLKYYDQKFWLEDGWTDFANHYNIKRGYMLMFRYDGNSELYVVILDTTTVEIDYFSASAPINFHDSKKLLITPKKEVFDGDFVQSFDQTKMVLAMPCSQPSHNDHLQSAIVPQPDPIGSLNISQNFQSIMRGPKRTKTSRIPAYAKQLRGDEKLAALQMASRFRSDRPFFKILMQPSLVYGSRLTFPYSFAKEHLGSGCCDVRLRVLEGRSWWVKYKYEMYGGRAAARFNRGWNLFAKDNNLGVGDVCVFVLLEGGFDVVFEVVIIRLNADSKIPISYM